MKKVLVLMLVLGIASGANATLSIKTQDGGAFEIVQGTTATFYIASDNASGYWGWVELANDTGVASYSGDPTFTPEGDPAGNSQMNYYPDYAGWYEYIVASTDTAKPIVAGNHIAVTLLGEQLGMVNLNLYESDGATLLLSQPIEVIPEPLTIALMGLGGLFLRRRK